MDIGLVEGGGWMVGEIGLLGNLESGGLVGLFGLFGVVRRWLDGWRDEVLGVWRSGWVKM